MNTLKTFDIRGKRLHIVYDESPEHPLDKTDAPFHVARLRSDTRHVYYRGHEDVVDVLPASRDAFGPAARIVVYFDDDGDEVGRLSASARGALYVDRAEWLAYAGAPASLSTLRAQLSELRDYWRGDVFGFILVKTFTREGKTYEAETIDSVFGFYGFASLRFAASYVDSWTLAESLRRFARRGV